MEGMIVINNCGRYRNVSKKELCGILLKESVKIWYSTRPRKFNSELDTLIVHINDTMQIQLYQTGVVRLFLEHEHYEKRKNVFISNLPAQVISAICGEDI